MTRHYFDPFLEAAAAKPEPLMLTENDVAALIQISQRKLQELRAQNIMPPVWKKIGKSVRYPARLLKAWIESTNDGMQSELAARRHKQESSRDSSFTISSDGYDEPLFRGGRRKKVQHQTFNRFLAEAYVTDEWLFVLRGVHGRPLDWLGTLDDKRVAEERVVWLTMGDFLESIQRSARDQQADLAKRELDNVLRSGKPTDPTRL